MTHRTRTGPLPHVDELRRFAVYAEPDPDDEVGEKVAVGVEFPDGPILADVNVASAPTTFPDMDHLQDATRSVADGTTWVEYEDGEPA